MSFNGDQLMSFKSTVQLHHFHDIKLRLSDIPSLKLTVRTWNLMVGIQFSFSEGLFSGALAVSFRDGNLCCISRDTPSNLPYHKYPKTNCYPPERGIRKTNFWLSQWPTFKLLGFTYLIGKKNRFQTFEFHGPFHGWVRNIPMAKLNSGMGRCPLPIRKHPGGQPNS